MREVGIWLAQGAVGSFLSVLFLQSGLDKVFDWSGNKAYITGYLEKTPFRPVSGFLFLVITLLEVAAGIVSAAGVLSAVLLQSPVLGLVGALLATASILSLFLGQRLAKDYASAAAMVPYFLVTVLALVLFGGT